METKTTSSSLSLPQVRPTPEPEEPYTSDESGTDEETVFDYSDVDFSETEDPNTYPNVPPGKREIFDIFNLYNQLITKHTPILEKLNKSVIEFCLHSPRGVGQCMKDYQPMMADARQAERHCKTKFKHEHHIYYEHNHQTNCQLAIFKTYTQKYKEVHEINRLPLLNKDRLWQW